MTPNPPVSNKNHSARKSLSQFEETSYVKHKTDVCRFDTGKENRNTIKIFNVLSSNISKCRGHTKKLYIYLYTYVYIYIIKH